MFNNIMSIAQKKRCNVEYNLAKKISIQRKSQILSLQIVDKSDDGINTIFPNQDKCGQKICEKFKNRSIINCLVYGMTQTGKTGCMTSLIQHYILSNLIPIDNIYIITGLSDKEWKKDTKNRMPDSINNRVFHRANLPKTFVEDIKEKKNFLIIMDEIQIACKENHTIHKIFKACKFYDLQFLLDNDVKLIQFSATPDGNINDIDDWKDYSTKVKLEPGVNYYGAKEAIETNRVKQFKNLSKIANVIEFKDEIKDKYNEPRYYLIRVPNNKVSKKGINNQNLVISNFKKTFGNDYDYSINYLKKKKDDINDILKIKPEKHTFIFYCEILRCAKTQFKKYIAVSYERYTDTINDSTIIQGSFGRLTGYDDNGETICYTNIPSITNYINLWNSNMEFKKGIIWNTKTTKYDRKDDLTYSNGTFNSVENIEQLRDGCSHKVKNVRGEPKIEKFKGEKGQLKMIEWYKGNLAKNRPGKRGPQKKKPIIEDGKKFFKATIRNNKCVILTTELVLNERKWGFNEDTTLRSYPCYADKENPDTLEWWLIYYD